MNYEIINFKKHKIFKIKIDGIDKDLLIHDFEMENELAKVFDVFLNNRAFGGFAIHHYETFRDWSYKY